MTEPNNRLKLTAHLSRNLSARSLAWTLGNEGHDRMKVEYTLPDRIIQFCIIRVR